MVEHLWGTHLFLFGGGGERNNTDSEQTTKKWEADETREKVDGRGRREGKTTKFAACVVDFLMSTTRLV